MDRVIVARAKIEPGQRYRDVRAGIYGRSAASEWIVEDVRPGTDGIMYARLVSVSDSTTRKTLAVTVLADPTRFEAL